MVYYCLFTRRETSQSAMYNTRIGQAAFEDLESSSADGTSDTSGSVLLSQSPPVHETCPLYSFRSFIFLRGMHSNS